MDRDTVSRLVALKTHRADRAEDALRHARAAATAAVEAAATARRIATDWSRELPEREARLFEVVVDRPVSQDELTGLRQAMASLRAEEELLRHRADEAADQVRAAQATVEAAVSALAEARRGVTKFEELVTVLRRAAAVEELRQEDGVMEEAASRGYGRADGESDEEGDGDEASWAA